MNQQAIPQSLPRHRSPWRTWRLGLGVLLVLRIVGEIVPLMDASGWLWVTRIAELWLVGGLVAWAWKGTPIREIATSVGWWRAAPTGILIVGLAAGQYLQVDFETYPFVKWDMYTARASEVIYAEIWMADVTGARWQLHLGVTGISTEPRAISGRLLNEAEAAAEGDSAARRLLIGTIEALNDRSGAGSANHAEVYRCTVNTPGPEAPSDCDLVISVDIGDSS